MKQQTFFFIILILLEARGHNLKEVTNVLQIRHNKKNVMKKYLYFSGMIIGTAQAQQTETGRFSY